MSQIDPCLDEASATLRSGSVATPRRIIVPLIRPAIVAALIVSFVSAMTSISAGIFLTSQRFDMATVNIVGRSEVGEYGYAAAYASVLIVLMVLARRADNRLRRQRAGAAGPSSRMRRASM